MKEIKITSVKFTDIENKMGYGKFEPDPNKCDASKYSIFSLEDAGRIFGGKNIYIWGAGQKGRGFLLALRRNGFDAHAFIDQSLEMQSKGYMGINVISPQVFFNENNDITDIFVLTASVESKNLMMAEELERHQFVRGINYESIQAISPFYPTVEVAGICNLRCSSCIRSDKDIIEDGKFMSFDNYKKVIEKLVLEIPFLYLVDLYIFGEPILNNEIEKIIKLNNELGLASGLSTNLYNVKNLEKVLNQHPAQIRVSLSGASSETYDVTHTGGKWKRVEKNLDYLGELVNELGSHTIVEVYYHIYKHNLHEIKIIKSLCEKHGFRFHPSLAVLFSDFAMQFSQNGVISKSAEIANDLTLRSLEDLLAECQNDQEKNCILTRIVPVINWDLSVMACCNYTYSSILPNYLEASIVDIIDKRTHSVVCAKCQSHSLHRWNNHIAYSDLVNELVLANA